MKEIDIKELKKRIYALNDLVEDKPSAQTKKTIDMIIEKNRENLEEMVKKDEEYKVLLKRKKAGESVGDLIKQYRNHVKILKKKDKENIKEWKRW